MPEHDRVPSWLKWTRALLTLVAAGLLANLLVVFFSQEGINWSDPWGWIVAYDVGLAMFWLLVGLGLLALSLWGRSLLKPKNLAGWGLALVATVVALIIFELALAPFNLVFDAANITGIDFRQRLQDAKQNPGDRDTLRAREHWWAKDEELGYGPLMGEEFAYSRHGALHNPWQAAKPQGVVRVIFVGDSITAYGFTSDALAQLNPASNYEYWNIGVWGYSTLQELVYFQRHGRPLKPDVVILGFCLNDWDGTPVLLQDQDGRVAIANMHVGERYFSYWWFQHSTIYRIFISLMASATGRTGTVESVAQNLARFQEMGRQDGFAFRVVVYPELDALAKWEQPMLEHRQRILKILERLAIPHYDAAPLLDQALAQHPRDWARMRPSDHFHPSRAFSRMIATELLARGFLKPPPGDARDGR